MFLTDTLWAIANHPEFEKFFIFWSVTLGLLPLGLLLACMSRRIFFGIFFIMIFSMCMPDELGISFLTHENYPGAAVRGFEIHLADLCAIILAATLFIRRETYKPMWLVPLTIPYALYLIVGLISWFFAVNSLLVPETRVLETFTAHAPDIITFETKLYPLFELFRVLRGFLIFWVTVNLVKDPQALRVFLFAVISTGIYLTIMALRERYQFGVYRVRFELQHPNDFAAYAAMIGAVILPLIFAVKRYWRSLFLGLVALGMAACMIMALSRSGLVIYAVALGLTTLLAYGKYLNLRNSILVGMGVLALGAGLWVARDTLEYQFTQMVSVQGSLDERLLFNEEARRMGTDHTWGVGLGNFSAWSWEKYAEDVDGDLAPGVPAHNIWYLTFAELGWLGLIVFSILWLRTYQLVLRSWWSSTGIVQMILLGVVLATLMVHLQSLLHFSYRNIAVYNLLQVCVGVTVGIYLWHSKPQTRKNLQADEELQFAPTAR